MITIVALIYNNKHFADFTVNSLERYTPKLHNGEAEFLFVANNATDDVKAHLKEKNYRHFIYDHELFTEEELAEKGFCYPRYIHGVYKAWNKAIELSSDIVCLINSDMGYSENWLENLLKHLDDTHVVTSKLVEPPIRSRGRKVVFRNKWTGSRAYAANFGRSISTFDQEGFNNFTKEKSVEGVERGGAYMPLVMYKRQAELVGYFPEGNVAIHGQPYTKYGQAGDEVFMKRLAWEGIEFITSLDSLVYHLNEGEMRNKL